MMIPSISIYATDNLLKILTYLLSDMKTKYCDFFVNSFKDNIKNKSKAECQFEIYLLMICYQNLFVLIVA